MCIRDSTTPPAPPEPSRYGERHRPRPQLSLIHISIAVTSISTLALKTLIARTIFAISNEESRYTLNGALLVIKAESLAMVATDGHRLSYVEKPNETLEGISGEKRVLIPRKALQELQQLLNNTEVEKVEFADDEHMLFFRVGHRTLSTRKLSGQFPNFEAVMPRDNTKFAVVRSSDCLLYTSRCV